MSHSILRYASIAAIALTVLVTISFVWNIRNIDRQTIYLATNEARANWNKDQAFRRWATRHGGLYVKPDDRTPPNPYLEHLPERDVVTTDGVKLTLMNPASMMSQMTKEFEELFGIKGKVTSQVLLNPANEPDAWELSALQKFDEGEQEIIEQSNIDGMPFIRLMRPMVMTEGCILCHGSLGFEVGDIRGGVSVSIPLTPYYAAEQESKKSLFFSHGSVWVFGILTIGFISLRGQKRENERREAESLLRRAHDNLEEKVQERTQELECQKRALDEHAIVSITDIKGNITYANDKLCEISGYTREELLGQNHRILKSEEHSPEFYSKIWKTISNGKVWNGNIKNKKKSGGFYWVDATIVPFLNVDGKPSQYIAIRTDITERKNAELSVESSLEKAETANRAKSELMANMSHELRTPLNAIIGFSDTMKEEVFGPLGHEKYREYLNDINYSGIHLLDLINDILDVSAIEAGVVELHEENISVSDVVDASIRIIMPRSNSGKVTVTSSVSSETPQIFADERRVKQVFLNLLSNAVKFTPEGGKVTVNSWLNEDASLSISVVDTGIGMDEDGVEKALSKFGQVDSGLDRKHEGTGLGLPLTIGLMECHGGTLEVKSEKGRGTQLTVIFPKERIVDNVC